MRPTPLGFKAAVTFWIYKVIPETCQGAGFKDRQIKGLTGERSLPLGLKLKAQVST